MNNKLLSIILIILILFNVTIISLIFIDIQVIAAPEATVSLAVVDLNQDSVTINTSLILKNPNAVSIAIADLRVEAKTSENTTIGIFEIPGGFIEGDEVTIFSSEDTLTLDVSDINEFKTIIALVSGKIKVKMLGIIEKTVPFSVKIQALFDKVINNISTPTLNLNVEIEGIDENGIALTGSLDIYNPNPFSLTIEDLSMDISSSNGETIGSVVVETGIASPDQMTSFPFIFRGNYTLFNKDIITITLNAEAGVIIAGLHQTISFGTEAEFEIPDIREVLSLDDFVSVTLTGEFQLTLRGIKAKISLLIDNPTTLPMEAENMALVVSSVNDDVRSPIVQENMTVCDIPAENQSCLEVFVTVPYRSLFSGGAGRLLPDFLAITIYGEVTLEGVNQSLPLEINGYLVPHLFRRVN